ncbi:hypothetical protein HOO65_060310 [Ceratocystis lukuohia]|uniref:C2H2-type domain-containing protein n=1 Tax=Ceratocystis lukuohia TaxID=2019550 RepID=A0ABR4MDY7_9PEZI
MNWCSSCKEPFHTHTDCKKHEKNRDCQPQAEFPVEHLTTEILNDSLKAIAKVDDEDKPRRLYQILFKCEPPTNVYFKFYGPPYGEAYGQAVLHTFLQCIVDKIRKTPVDLFLPQYETKQYLISLIKDAAKGLVDPANRQELSRLAMEKAQEGLGPMSLPSFPLQEPFALTGEGNHSSTGVVPPESLNIDPMSALQDDQSTIPPCQQPYDFGYGQQGSGDIHWSMGTLNPAPYTNVTPGVIGNTAPSTVDIALGNYANVNGVGDLGEYPTSTGYDSHFSFGVYESIRLFPFCGMCNNGINPDQPEGYVPYGTQALCRDCHIASVNGNGGV